MSMTAALPTTPRRSRLANWLGGQPRVIEGGSSTIGAGPVDSRHLVERQLFADIGDFLFTHQLALTPLHFQIAHAYLTASDPAVVQAIGAMLADDGRLDPARLAAVTTRAERPAETVPQALAGLADQLEARLVECLSAADRSQTSARDYGNALDIAQTTLATDPIGTLEHIAGLTREVVSTTRLVESELAQTRREAERLRSDLDVARAAAERDHLTGLPNRRGFERRLSELLGDTSGDSRRRLTVALCDIDDFKRVNDVHGHQAGDRVLKFVGGFLASELGGDACVARYGGEEFAILIEGRSVHEAVMLLDEVRARLAARSLINQETGAAIGRITFSAGAATLVDNVNRALGAADAALYRAKRDGKNAVQIASTVN